MFFKIIILLTPVIEPGLLLLKLKVKLLQKDRNRLVSSTRLYSYFSEVTTALLISSLSQLTTIFKS